MRFDRMHVGYEVSDLLYPDGAGVYTYASELLRELMQREEEIRLTALLADHGEVRALSKEGWRPPERVPYEEARRVVPLLGLTRGRWRNDYRTRRIVYAIDRHVLKPLARTVDVWPALAQTRFAAGSVRSIDVCHWSDTVFMRLPHTAGVVTIHDTVALRPESWHAPVEKRHHAQRLRRYARYATRIIAVSESTRCDVINQLGVSPDRVDVIPLAAATDFRPPVDEVAEQQTLERYGLRRGEYILHVGTIEPRKNLVRLATAFKQALEGVPESPMRLVLVGKRGWLTDPIDAGLAQLDLADRLVMPGRLPREELPALMHGSRAVAYVSLYEGFGLPPLEAMACGAAVVASNTSSIPEVVGNAALLVDPHDVHNIAVALLRLMTDDALRDDLAARGLMQAARFSWARTAEGTLDVYRQAAETVRCARRPRHIASVCK